MSCVYKRDQQTLPLSLRIGRDEERGYFVYLLLLDTDPKKILLNLPRKKSPQPIVTEFLAPV